MQRRFIISVAAAITGWVAAIFLCLVRESPKANEFGAALIFYAMVSGIIISSIYLVLLLPLALFVPSTSRLWRWYICVPCGFGAGCALMWRLFARNHSQDFSLSWALIGGTVGAVTCATGCALLRHRSYPTPASKAHLHGANH